MKDTEAHSPCPSTFIGFKDTLWPQVLSAADPQSPESQQALEKLCRTYWPPLYSYLRRHGHKPHDAQDLTQAFFAGLLQSNGLARARPDLGRFRTFLLTALQRFAVDDWRHNQAQKRGGGQSFLSLDEDEAERSYQLGPADHVTPEKLFDQKWALTVLNAALARLENEFLLAGRSALFERLRAHMVDGMEAQSYPEIALHLGMSEEAVKKAAQRMRQRFGEIMREEIAHTVPTSSEIDEELRYLWSALSD